MGVALALAGGVCFGAKILAAVGWACERGAGWGLTPLVEGWALGTDVEESLGVLGGGRTVLAEGLVGLVVGYGA